MSNEEKHYLDSTSKHIQNYTFKSLYGGAVRGLVGQYDLKELYDTTGNGIHCYGFTKRHLHQFNHNKDGYYEILNPNSNRVGDAEDNNIHCQLLHICHYSISDSYSNKSILTRRIS